jgi:hypothetical protein
MHRWISCLNDVTPNILNALPRRPVGRRQRVPANKKMVSSFELPDAERVEAGIWPATTHQTFKTKEPGEELAVVRS